VDTIGAGDAFTAGLLAYRLEGRPLTEAAAFANRLAARVAASAGGTPRIERRQVE
jgi:fructokinase